MTDKKPMEKDSLDNFSTWDNLSVEDTDLFEQLDKQESKKDEIKSPEVDEEITKKEEEDTTTTEKDSEKEEENEDLFSNAEKEEVDLDSEDEETEEGKRPKSFEVLEHLRSKGLIDFEIEEDQELTEEDADDLLEDHLDKAVESKIEALFQELPDVLKDLNRYHIQGGDVNEYLKKISEFQSFEITDNLDIEDESIQEKIVRKSLEAQHGNDEDLIESQLEFFKDSGKLQGIAEKFYTKWKKDFEIKRKEQVENQRRLSEEIKNKIRESKREITNILSSSNEINGLTINKKDIRNLPSYINDRNVKLENGSVITEMQKDLFYDIPNNKKAMAQLAILLKNRNEDGTFNFERIEKSAKTSAFKEVKNNIRRSKQEIPNGSKTGKIKPNKSLADFFE